MTTTAVPFAEALQNAAAIAALSPSSHNCQPWALAHLASAAARTSLLPAGPVPAADSREEYLALGIDRDHQLDSLPAHDIEMVLSCGIYARLLARGLAAQGWQADHIDLMSEHAPVVAWPLRWRPLTLLRLRTGTPAQEHLDDLRQNAGARCTNRGPYSDEVVDDGIIGSLGAPEAGIHAALVDVRHLVSADERERFAALVVRHGGRDFRDQRAWRETHSFIRPSQAGAARAGDGFSLAQLFGPMPVLRRYALRAALAPTTMRVLCHVGYHHLLARELAAVVRTSPVIVAMCLRQLAPTESEVLQAGARLIDYWLAATAAGLVLHPISVLMQHDDVREEVQDAFGLPGRAFFVSRLGYPTMRFGPSPRRPASAAWRTL